jgi:hypothetical protein
MEWVDALRGSVVAVDTTPLMYFIEEDPRYLFDEYRVILLHADNVETLPVRTDRTGSCPPPGKTQFAHGRLIQIAMAIKAAATRFLTNDTQLAGQWIPNILILDHLLIVP